MRVKRIYLEIFLTSHNYFTIKIYSFTMTMELFSSFSCTIILYLFLWNCTCWWRFNFFSSFYPSVTVCVLSLAVSLQTNILPCWKSDRIQMASGWHRGVLYVTRTSERVLGSHVIQTEISRYERPASNYQLGKLNWMVFMLSVK